VENNNKVSNNSIQLITEEELKKINQKLGYEPINDLRNSNFILFRHAYSQYNYEHDIFKAEKGKEKYDGPEAKYLRLDPKYIDAPLHAIGENQAVFHR
jgi:hypothetical protein